MTSSARPQTGHETYAEALGTSRQFVGVQDVRQAWTKRYSSEAYLKLLWTFSAHRALPEPDRSRLFEAIGRVIVRMGGEMLRDDETLALLAKKG